MHPLGQCLASAPSVMSHSPSLEPQKGPQIPVIKRKTYYMHFFLIKVISPKTPGLHPDLKYQQLLLPIPVPPPQLLSVHLCYKYSLTPQGTPDASVTS